LQKKVISRIFAINKSIIENMTRKEIRLDYIRKILTQQNVRSQEDLLEKLSTLNCKSTQATLSRDLRQLRALRTSDQFGNMRYILPTNPNYTHVVKRKVINEVPIENSLLDFEDGGIILVLHTIPGFANALASTIDSKDFDSVAGTLAGDDTVIVVGTNGFAREDIIKDLSGIVPQIAKKD
jgi:transcriptional regulator of arginine metabolism